MKLDLQYGTGVIVLPGNVFPDKMPPDAAYLHVLLAICAAPALLYDTEALYPAVAAQCRLPLDLVKNAVSYWMACGVLTPSDEAHHAVSTPTEALPQAAAALTSAPQAPETMEAPKTIAPEAPAKTALPDYPMAEVARIIEEHGLRSVFEECAVIAGKTNFSEHEIKQLTILYDRYGLDGAYLMTLFMYCKNMYNKTSVSYVFKTGLALYDDGIRTVEALDAHAAHRERCRDSEYQIRRLFGIGDRALTAKEKEYIEAWVTWNFPMDVITRAFEITVKNIDKPRMSYVNKILSGWNENGIRTLEAVEAAEAQFAREKHPNGKAQEKDIARDASYDIDEFLALAMKRSFEDNG